MALSGSGEWHISPQLYAGTCGQARRPFRHPGGGHSGRLHPVSAPERRRLPPQIPGSKRLEPSAACRPCKGQPDKHPLLGKRTKDHQSEVLLPSGGKPWFRFSIYASHVRVEDFFPDIKSARLWATESLRWIAQTGFLCIRLQNTVVSLPVLTIFSLSLFRFHSFFLIIH